MTDRVGTQHLTVAYDYGEFALLASSEIEYAALVDAALVGPGVAAGSGAVVVISSHQQNFETALTVELWDGQPPEDSHEWVELFEASISATGRDLLWASPTMPHHALDVPSGDYRVRIAGRGFSAPGRPLSTEPGDTWRIRFWLGSPLAARRLRAYEPPAPEPLPVPDEPDEPTVAAALAHLAEAVTAGLPAGTGVVTSTTDLGYPSDVVFKRLRHFITWIGKGGSPQYDIGGRFVLYIDLSLQFSVVGSVTTVREGNKVEAEWGWQRGWDPYPEPATHVVLELDGAAASTTLTVRHERVPARIEGDLTILWQHWLAELHRRLEVDNRT